jgi:hypothetical protein
VQPNTIDGYGCMLYIDRRKKYGAMHYFATAVSYARKKVPTMSFDQFLDCQILTD